MEKNVLIRDLTETEILSEVRRMFPGQHVAALKLQPLIDQSETLGDLYNAITKALHDLEKDR